MLPITKSPKSCIILAAGNHSRWTPDFPKQLCRLPDGDSVLSRLIKQCHHHNWDPIIASNHPQILDFAIEHMEFFFRPEHNLYTCSTALASQAYWGKETLILCGDVVLTLNGAATLFNTKEETPLFFGTSAEIFGFRSSQSQDAHVKKHLRIAIREARNEKGYGKLWNLYRSMEGFGIQGKPASIKWHRDGGLLHEIADGSKDIDTLDDYNYITKTLLA